MGKNYKFTAALIGENQWISPAYVALDAQGSLIELGETKADNTDYQSIDGFAIPGFQNAHSHAFQYAMAGEAESHATDKTPDDFWSWREAMYRVALEISPDEMQRVATDLYKEMVRHGYTEVAEFHYIHHDRNGNPFHNKAEMGTRLIEAAQEAGIAITLVPMFYQKGGFGQAPTDGQRRFISPTAEDYYALWESSRDAVKNYDRATLGFGFHSLRAVDQNSMKEALGFAGSSPIHIHISEQKKEIEDCLAYYKKRPVDYLFDSFMVDDQWHLVHATHLADSELNAITGSGAQVVICPSTEGSLGDGIFRLREFIAQKGNWSIGTDSHVGIDPKEELRLLDYGQRLISHKRNTYYSRDNGDSGSFAFHQTLLSGRKAMGNNNKTYFKDKMPFDAVILNAQNAKFQGLEMEKIMSKYIYTCDSSVHLGTMLGGDWVSNDKQG